MKFHGISIMAQDAEGRPAVLVLQNIEAHWVAMDASDADAMPRFVPTEIFEVDISSVGSSLRSLVEQRGAHLTVFGFDEEDHEMAMLG